MLRALQGVAVTEEGWRFPPFIVVERGESLDEWHARIQPDFPTIVQVLSHLLERVCTLHSLGVVHRDLKPGNVLWRPGQHSWTLIDYGCASMSGELLRTRKVSLICVLRILWPCMMRWHGAAADLGLQRITCMRVMQMNNVH